MGGQLAWGTGAPLAFAGGFGSGAHLRMKLVGEFVLLARHARSVRRLRYNRAGLDCRNGLVRGAVRPKVTVTADK